MKLDLSSIIKSYGAQLKFNEDLDLSDTEIAGQAIKIVSPVKVSGNIINSGSVLEMSANARGSLTTNCARCAKELNTNFSIDIKETLMQGVKPPNDEVILLTGYTVSLDEIVSTNILSSLPIRYLCSDNCKGLCSMCGTDLNVGQCNCSSETYDPRFEELAKLLKKK